MATGQSSLSAGSRTSAAVASLAKLQARIKAKAHTVEINFNRLCFFHELFVYYKFNTFNVKKVVAVFRLIQSHC